MRRLQLEGAGTLAAMTGVYTLMLYLITVLFARLMGPHQFGIYSVVVAATTISGTIATPGIEQLLTRDLAIYRAQSHYGLAHGLVRASHRLALAMSILLALALCILAQISYSESGPRQAMMLGASLIPLTALARVRAAIIAGLGSVVLARMPELVLRPLVILSLMGIWILLGERLGAVEAVSLTVLAAGASFFVGSLIVRAVLRARIPTTVPLYAMHRWRRAALPFFVLAIADIVTGQIGVILVQALGTSADAGLFAVALRGSAIVALCFVGVSAAIGPSAARRWASGDPAGLLRSVRRMVLFSVAFAAPTAAFIAMFASPLLSIFGDEFTPAAGALRLLCLGQLAFATFGIFGTVLLMTGEEGLAARIMVGGLIVGVTLNVALIPSQGLEGAAIATTLALLACYGAMPIALWRRWPQIRRTSGSPVHYLSNDGM